MRQPKNNKPNKLKHPAFPQPKVKTISVWRYMDLAKLIALIQEEALYFTRLDHLPDAHEGSTPEIMVRAFRTHVYDLTLKTIYDNLVSTHGVKEGKNKFEENYDQHKALAESNTNELFLSNKSFFVNCWHMGDYESEAMWRLYCSSETGVAIQTSYAKLVDSISHNDDVYIGKVNYIDYEKEVFPPNNAFHAVMHKRKGFAHENEIRLVQWKSAPEDKRPHHLTAEWDYLNTIEKIYVNPYAPQYYFDAVQFLISKIAPKLLGRIQWSKMKSIPYPINKPFSEDILESARKITVAK